MKALTIRTFVFSMILVMSSAFTSLRAEKNLVYGTKTENDQVVSKTIFEKDNQSNILRMITRYENSYDQSGRVLEKKA